MGQLVRIAEVYEEFTANAIRDALGEQNIPCVVFNNEIPMRPGFTFDLRPWGAVLVREEDRTQAQEIAETLLAVMHGPDGESTSMMPAQISVHSRHWVGLVCIVLVFLELLLGLLFTFMDELYRGSFWLNLPFLAPGMESENAAGLLFLILFNLLAGIIALSLMFLNWERCWRVLSAAFIGMLSLPVILVYGLYSLLHSGFFAIMRFAHGRWPEPPG